MSSPRAATSVATSRSAAPPRNRCITRSRCSCVMPPCSASAGSPRRVERLGQLVHLGAACGRRRWPRPGPPGPGCGRARPACAPRRDHVGRLPDPRRLAGSAAAPARCGSRTGSVRWRRRSPRSAAAWWRRRAPSAGRSGVSARIASMSSAKPMSSISSASSSTTAATAGGRAVPGGRGRGPAPGWRPPRPRPRGARGSGGVSAARRTPAARARRRPAVGCTASATCIASSRVGARMSTAGAARRRRAGRQPVQERQREGGRLPGPGGRPGRRGRGPRAGPGSPPAGSGWAPRTRARSAGGPAPGPQTRQRAVTSTTTFPRPGRGSRTRSEMQRRS